MGLEFDFNIDKKNVIHCSKCGKPLLCSELDKTVIKMRCSCGTPVNIRQDNGIVLVAVPVA